MTDTTLVVIVVAGASAVIAAHVPGFFPGLFETLRTGLRLPGAVGGGVEWTRQRVMSFYAALGLAPGHGDGKMIEEMSRGGYTAFDYYNRFRAGEWGGDPVACWAALAAEYWLTGAPADEQAEYYLLYAWMAEQLAILSDYLTS